MKRIRELTGPLHVRPFRWLYGAALLSTLGSFSARLALGLLILDRTGSPSAMGAVMAASFLPWLGLGQWLSTLADRMDRRKVMVATDVIRAGLAFGIALLPLPVWGYALLAFLIGAASAPFNSSVSAVLPTLVGCDVYPSAVRLRSASNQAASMLGFAVGGLLSAWLSPVGAIAIDGASYIVSAVMLSRLPALRPQSSAADAGVRPGMMAGVHVLRQDVWVRRSLLITLALAFGGGAIEDMVVAFSDQVIGRGDAYAGLLALAVPLGTAVSAVLQSSSVDPARLIRISASLAIGAGALMFPLFAFGSGVGAAFAGFFFVGVAFSAILPANVIAGLRIPDTARGSVMGFFQGLIMGTYALATLVGGLAVDALGAAPFISGASLFIVGVGACSLFASAVPKAHLEEPAVVAI